MYTSVPFVTTLVHGIEQRAVWRTHTRYFEVTPLSGSPLSTRSTAMLFGLLQTYCLTLAVRRGRVCSTIGADNPKQTTNSDSDIYGPKRASRQGDLPKDSKYYIRTSHIADIVSHGTMIPGDDALTNSAGSPMPTTQTIDVYDDHNPMPSPTEHSYCNKTSCNSISTNSQVVC